MKPIHLLSTLLLCHVFMTVYSQDVSKQRFPADSSDRPWPNVPKGEVLSFQYSNSKVYPGTSRRYWLYIPAEYKANKPACLYVCLDGVIFNAPTVFDYLIWKGEMPVTIGLFIEPGAIRDKDSSVIRYNRTNEFDNVNGHFARFIESEIIPDALTRAAGDGRVIKLSTRANDHLIAGASSGAICSFTAAWYRPDLFSRVFSAIGTYVGMRGGDQYPVLIRKSEPKPIRIFLQDNTNDTWNPLFGNWYKANRDMEAALKFGGYEVTTNWQDGLHDTHQATNIFADAMRWLWKDWPAPVNAGSSGNDMLTHLLIPGSDWDAVDQGKNRSIPSAADPADPGLPSGDHYLLKDTKIIYRVRGKTDRVVDEDSSLGYCLAISPDKKQLVAAIRHSRWLYDYVIGADGSLKYKQRLYWLHDPGQQETNEIRSLAFDREGNLYAATSLGVQICDQNGRVRAILSPGAGGVDTLWFGGDGNHTLYVRTAAGLFCRKLNATGALSTDKPAQPDSQGPG